MHDHVISEFPDSRLLHRDLTALKVVNYKRKIIVKITGGLGNQLFQYASGRAVAEHNNCEIWIDRSFYRNQYSEVLNSRQCFLAHLMIKAKFLDKQRETMLNLRFKQPLPLKLIQKISDWANFSKSPKIIQQSPLTSLKNVSIPNRGVFLIGHWQDYTNFDFMRDKLLEELRPKCPPPEGVRRFEADILSSNSVSIHIRRGDYLNEEVESVHGILPMSYYTSILDKVLSIKPKASIFFFSDDLPWVRAHFGLKYPNSRFVMYEKQFAEPYWDLFLMSQCSVNVVANSTFSWWGAYLNRDRLAKVYIPKNWLLNPINHNNKLKLSNWVAI